LIGKLCGLGCTINYDRSFSGRECGKCSSQPSAFSRPLETFVVKQALKTHFWLRPPLCAVQDAGDFDNAFADAINGKEG
jgi:hypothetical protein